MSMPPRSKPRLLAVAGLAVVAAWLGSSVRVEVDPVTGSVGREAQARASTASGMRKVFDA